MTLFEFRTPPGGMLMAAAVYRESPYLFVWHGHKQRSIYLPRWARHGLLSRTVQRVYRWLGR